MPEWAWFLLGLACGVGGMYYAGVQLSSRPQRPTDLPARPPISNPDRLYFVPHLTGAIQRVTKRDLDIEGFHNLFTNTLQARLGRQPQDRICRVGMDNPQYLRTEPIPTSRLSGHLVLDFVKMEGTERMGAFATFVRRFERLIGTLPSFDGRHLRLAVLRGDGTHDKRIYTWEIPPVDEKE